MVVTQVSNSVSGALSWELPKPTSASTTAFPEALSAADSRLAGANGQSEPQLERLRSGALSALSEFKRALREAMRQAGIEPGALVRLESDGSGGVMVNGYHPQRDLIEQLFADNPDLAQKFQGLAARFSQLRAIENPDPNPPLIEPVFGLLMAGDELEVAFA